MIVKIKMKIRVAVTVRVIVTKLITRVNPIITIIYIYIILPERLVFSHGLISEREERPPPPELLHVSSSADSPFPA